MKRLFAVYAFVGAFVFSCATLKAPVASCAAVPGLVDEVAADLASPDYEARLEALVVRVGLCIVDRTVEAVIAPSSAKSDATIVAHGRAWLAAHPVAA